MVVLILTNQVSFNSSTNQIIFIHRTNNKLFVADDVNNGQYRYDVSRDGGATWTVNRGLLNPSGTQAGFACRFPNATMYNPTGDTNPDNPCLTYFGSFIMELLHLQTGKGIVLVTPGLDNAPATFTKKIYTKFI